LSEDDNNEVRRYVACNESTPIKTLEKMKSDVDGTTAALARGTFGTIMSKKAQNSEMKFDFSKLSPELREKVKDWDAEDIKKFLGWLKKQKEEGEA
jgi:hypothetical protein